MSVIEIAELLSAVAHLDQAGTAMLGMTAADFPLPTLGPRLLTLAAELDTGRGFWLLRGLPIDQLTERQAAFAYWGLGLHMGVPVSQNARGHLLGHVIDEGLDYKTDNSARGYQTRLRLPYHTDSSDVVGLLCLKPAKTGGLSSVASTTSTFNEVVKRRPDLAHFWFQEWYYDRRDEERPGEKPYFTTPLATLNEGLLLIRRNVTTRSLAEPQMKPSSLTSSTKFRTRKAMRCIWTSVRATSSSCVITRPSIHAPSTKISRILPRSDTFCVCG